MTENQEPIPELPVGLAEKVEPQAEKPVDPALIEKLEVLRRISQIDSLLENSLFVGGAALEIIEAKQFLRKLHSPILADCQAHPDFARATKKPEAAPPLPPSEVESLRRAEEKRNRKERRASN